MEESHGVKLFSKILEVTITVPAQNRLGIHYHHLLHFAVNVQSTRTA